MFLALDPGTRAAGALPEGGTRASREHALGRQRRRGARVSSTATRAPTWRSCSTPAARPSRRRRGRGGPDRLPGPARDASSASSRPRATATAPTAGLIERRHNVKRVIHNFQLLSTELATKDKQLAALVDSSNANFAGASPTSRRSLREALRLFPATLSQTTATLNSTGDARRRARPGAAGAAPVRARAGARAAQDAPVPARDDADRPRPDPAVRARRAADRARPAQHREAARAGHAAADAHVRGAEQVFNELAYDPPGAGDSYLFWAAWARTRRPRCSPPRTPTARSAAASC